MRYTQDRPVYNHLSYMQGGNLTNPKPNSNPNRNSRTLFDSY